MDLVARLLLFAFMLSAGCSFALAGPDPARPRGKPPQCDSGKGLVTLDALVATGLGIGGLSLLSSSDSSSHGAAVVPLLLGALYTGAALRGNSVVNACREEQATFVAYQQEPAAPPLPPKPRVVASAPPPVVSPAPEPKPEPPPEPAPWSDFWKEQP